MLKTYRDDYMMRIAEEYPVYNWQKNQKDIRPGTQEAVMRYGLSPYHRMSFNHEFEQLRLFERPAENQK